MGDFISLNLHNQMPKKAVNLSLDSLVLEEAKLLGINISQVCNSFLESYIKSEKERLWKLEHSDFFSSYNELIELDGLPLEQWRSF
jgi:antitoxin CcdA